MTFRAPPEAWTAAGAHCLAVTSTTVVRVQRVPHRSGRAILLEVFRSLDHATSRLSAPWDERELRPSGFVPLDAATALDLAALLVAASEAERGQQSTQNTERTA